VGASVLAAPLALFTGRARFRGRHIVAVAALVPLALPPYNVALALRGWLPAEPLLASSLVLSLALYPIPFVFLRAALASVDPRLEEAGILARGLGVTLRRITWPLVRPWAVAAAGIVFLLGLGEFGAAAFLGLPVYAGQITLRFAATYDAAGAAVAAIPLVGAVLVVLALESAALRRVELFQGRLRPALVFDAAGWTLPVQVSCLAILFLSPGLPILLTVLELDARGFSRALPMAIRPALNSLLVAGSGAVVAVVVALALALLARRGARVYRWISLTFFVIPGAVFSIALIGFWNHPRMASLSGLYGTMGLLVVAVVVRYTVLAERTIDAELRNIPAAEEQVARLAGRSESSIALKILCPQIATPIVAGATAFLLFALRDLDAMVTIYPPGGETLAVRLYTVLANSPRGLQAALSLAQMALTLPVVLVLVLTLRKSRWSF
jgi:iron(III) transport system permease protein